MRDDLTDLSSKLHNFQAKLAGMEQKMDSYPSNTDITNKLSAVESKLDDTDTDDDLEGTLATLETEVMAFKVTSIPTFQQSDAALQGRIDALKGKLGKLEQIRELATQLEIDVAVCRAKQTRLEQDIVAVLQ